MSTLQGELNKNSHKQPHNSQELNTLTGTRADSYLYRGSWTWRTLASRVWLTFRYLTDAWDGITAMKEVLLMEFPQHTSITPNISSMFLMGILIIYHLDYQSCLIYASLLISLNAEQTDTEQVI